MTKENVINSIIFIMNSIVISHINDMEDDVAVDLIMTWIVMMMYKFTWSMTADDMESGANMAANVHNDIVFIAHLLTSPF
jgi:response regulator of citrate/malate metabolism